MDLLDGVLAELRRMASEAQAAGKTFVGIFLGDYIDRGPDSRAVLSRLLALKSERTKERYVFLRGNHEQVLLDLLSGVEKTSRWLDFGGAQTLQSYGGNSALFPDDEEDGAALATTVRSLIPKEHISFLGETELFLKLGGYLFVHAGLRPDRLLEEQSEADMLWYRFYTDSQPIHGEMVVHGHSPNPTPVVGRWRIGIDTEAYASGSLTILKLDGEQRDFFKLSVDETGAPPIVGPWTETSRTFKRQAESAPLKSSSEQTSRKRSHRPRRRTERPAAAPLRRRHRFWAAGACAVGATALVGAAGVAALGTTPAARLAPVRVATQLRGPIAAPVLFVAAQSNAANPSNARLRPPNSVRPTPLPTGETDNGSKQPAAKNIIAPPPRPLSSVASRAPAALNDTPPAPLHPPSSLEVAQIGAEPSAAEARKTWDTIAKAFPEIMAGKTFSTEIVSANGGHLHRSFVMGFTSRDQAHQFCSELTNGDHPCLVRRTHRSSGGPDDAPDQPVAKLTSSARRPVGGLDTP